MAWELLWWPAADRAMDRIEGANDARTAAVHRTLARLEANPFDPRLGTRQFQTPGYGHIRATPCRHDDCYILWQVGAEPDTAEIVTIADIAF